MKLLIVGPKGTQQHILDALKIDNKLEEYEGACFDHIFETKYFTQQVGIWVDEFEDWKEWATSFASEDAQPVREALLMIIIGLQRDCFASAQHLKPFLEVLKKERPNVMVAGLSSSAIEPEVQESYYKLGIDVLEPSEVLDSVYSAIIDWEEQEPAEDSDFEHEQPSELLKPLLEEPGGGEPLVDLESMVKELKLARQSDMSDEDRQALAEKLAKQLVP